MDKHIPNYLHKLLIINYLKNWHTICVSKVINKLKN